ncbi:conserved membrane protein [Mycobacterium tuberculosis '98-R604 INH-RIF-EM']|nr:conserved membrane protein [Mycobacterium tuberculosis '98-R604 INH-RIF-EM']
MTHTPIPRPDARYGRPRLSRRARRRVAIALGVLVAAAGIVIAVIGYQRISTSAVTGSLVAIDWSTTRRHRSPSA